MTAAIFKKSMFSNFNYLKPVKKLGFVDSIFGNFKQKTLLPKNHVDIIVVDESLHFIDPQIEPDEVVTVIYNRDSLDSLYGLAFFRHLYNGQVQAIQYNNAHAQNDIQNSKETIIVGVEVSVSDLVHFNSLTESVSIFGYRGSFGYLYNERTKKQFDNVKLYQCDNDFYIGGKGISKLENSVAMMLKILYYRTSAWSSWSLMNYAISVAHATCFYENIPDYQLTKSTFVVNRIKDNNGKEVSKASIHNFNDVLMHDLRTKLEAAATDPNHGVFVNLPLLNLDEYRVYRQRLQNHIDRTRILQGWLGKGIITGDKLYAYCIPVMGFAVQDILALSSNNVGTTVCIEDIGDKNIYYVYSKHEGNAKTIADILGGEHTWMQGNIICVSKIKSPQERR